MAATLDVTIRIKEIGANIVDGLAEKVKKLNAGLSGSTSKKLAEAFKPFVKDTKEATKGVESLNKQIDALTTKTDKLGQNLKSKLTSLEDLKSVDVLGKDFFSNLEESFTKSFEKIRSSEVLEDIANKPLIDTGENRALEEAAKGFETIGARATAITTAAVGLGAMARNTQKLGGVTPLLTRFFDTITTGAKNGVTNIQNLSGSVGELYNSTELLGQGFFAFTSIFASGLGGVLTSVTRGVGLLVAGKVALGEASIFAKKLRGEGVLSLSPMQRAARLTDTLDQSINRSFISGGKLLAVGASLGTTIVNPLVGAIPLVNQVSGLVGTRIEESKSKMSRFFGSGRDAYIIIFQEVRTLLSELLPELLRLGRVALRFIRAIDSKHMTSILEKLTGIDRKTFTMTSRFKAFVSGTWSKFAKGVTTVFKVLASPITLPIAGFKKIAGVFKSFNANRFTSFKVSAPKAPVTNTDRLQMLNTAVATLDARVNRIVKRISSGSITANLEGTLQRIETRLVTLQRHLTSVIRLMNQKKAVRDFADSVDMVSKKLNKPGSGGSGIVKAAKEVTNSVSDMVAKTTPRVKAVSKDLQTVGDTMTVVAQKSKTAGNDVKKVITTQALTVADATNNMKVSIGKALKLPGDKLKTQQTEMSQVLKRLPGIDVTQFQRSQGTRQTNAMRAFFASLNKGEINKGTITNLDSLRISLDKLFTSVSAGKIANSDLKVLDNALKSLTKGTKARDLQTVKENLDQVFTGIEKLTGKKFKNIGLAANNFIGAINKGLADPKTKADAERILFRFTDALAAFFPQSPPKKGGLKKALANIGKFPKMLGDGLTRSAPKADKGAGMVAQRIADFFPQSPPRRGALINLVSSGGKIVQMLDTGMRQASGLVTGTSRGIADSIREELDNATRELFFAERVGDSIENLSVLRGALKDTGVDASDFNFVLSNVFNRKMSPEQLKSLENFGLSFDKINNSASPTIELFRQLSQGVKTFGTQSQVTNEALEAAGIIQTSDLIPALKIMGDSFDTLIDKQLDLGLATSSTFAEQARVLNVSVNRFERLKEILKENFFGGFTDDLQETSSGLLKFVENNRSKIQALAQFTGRVLGKILTFLSKFVQFAVNKPSEAFNSVVGVFTSVGKLLFTTVQNILDQLSKEIQNTLLSIGSFVLTVVYNIVTRAGKIALAASKDATQAVGNSVGDSVASALGYIGVLDAEAVKMGQNIAQKFEKDTPSALKDAVTGIFNDAKEAAESAEGIGESGGKLIDKFFGAEFQAAQQKALGDFSKNMGAAFSDPDIKDAANEFMKGLSFDGFAQLENEIEAGIQKTKANLRKEKPGNTSTAARPSTASAPAVDRISSILTAAADRVRGTGDITIKFKEDLKRLQDKHKKELEIVRAFGATEKQERRLLESQKLEITRLSREKELALESKSITERFSGVRKKTLELQQRITGDRESRQQLELLNLQEKHARELLEVKQFLKDKNEAIVRAELDKIKELQAVELANKKEEQGGGGFLDNLLNLNPTIPLTKGMEKLMNLGRATAGVFGELGQVFGDMFEQSGRKLKAFLVLQKGLSISQAIINIAVGVTKALSTLPPPLSYIQAGAVALAGGVQIAKIQAQGFKDGGSLTTALDGKPGGLITQGAGGGADDVLIRGDKNEYMLNARATGLLGVDFLDQVNALSQPKSLPAFLSGVPAKELTGGVDLKKFNNGGLIGGAPRGGNPATAAISQVAGQIVIEPNINVTMVNIPPESAAKSDFMEFLASSDADNIIINKMSKNPTKFSKALNKKGK